MNLDHYLQELQISGPQRRGAVTSKKDVRKIQAWLSLFELSHPGSGTSCAVDGGFGPATEEAVKKFQQAEGLAVTGAVDQTVFDRLVLSLRNAFTAPLSAVGLRARILEAAQAHVVQRPFELAIDNESNSGPWVRSYMDGNEGQEWLWCAGFVQSVLHQAASSLGKNLFTLMPRTFSCDTLGTTAIQKGLLRRFGAVRQNPALAQPGDLFLIQKTPHDWVHVGIIMAINADTFETAEGNTNGGGSSNGNAALRRIRNFRMSKLDVFSIQPLV